MHFLKQEWLFLVIKRKQIFIKEQGQIWGWGGLDAAFQGFDHLPTRKSLFWTILSQPFLPNGP